MRKTKIICTLGPAVDDEETLRNTVKAVQALDFVAGDPSILRVLD